MAAVLRNVKSKRLYPFVLARMIGGYGEAGSGAGRVSKSLNFVHGQSMVKMLIFLSLGFVIGQIHVVSCLNILLIKGLQKRLGGTSHA